MTLQETIEKLRNEINNAESNIVKFKINSKQFNSNDIFYTQKNDLLKLKELNIDYKIV